MYIAVDIGGTKTLVAAVSAHGEIVEQSKFPTPADYQQFLKELKKSLTEFAQKDFQAGCVAVPGLLDRKHGRAMAYGNLKWHEEPIEADIEKLTHCPIVIENDAKLAGLSEAMLVKNEFKKVLYITISTGIGTSLIVNGKIDPEFQDAEGGHILLEHDGKIMPWEDFASGRAIFKKYGKKAGEITDDKTWHEISRALAVGIMNHLAIVQPEVIIIGGGVGTHFNRFEKPLIAELKKYESPLVPIPPLRQAGRPETAVIFGCYDLAKTHYGHSA